jgi:NAD-dependent SIR2 family protein deacetylase
MKSASEMESAHVAILVGAGMSRNSEVPLFKDFRDAFLEPLLGHRIKGKSGPSSINVEVFPPEQLFYRLSKLGPKYELSVLSTLREYSFDRSPNLNHYVLCEAIKAGASVWTTNYDVLIEKAAFDIGLRCHALAWPGPPVCTCWTSSTHRYRPCNEIGFPKRCAS